MRSLTICKNCNEYYEDHVAKRCLFDSTKFEPVRCYFCNTNITYYTQIHIPPILIEMLGGDSICRCWQDSTQRSSISGLCGWVEVIGAWAHHKNDTKTQELMLKISNLKLNPSMRMSRYSSLTELFHMVQSKDAK